MQHKILQGFCRLQFKDKKPEVKRDRERDEVINYKKKHNKLKNNFP